MGINYKTHLCSFLMCQKYALHTEIRCDGIPDSLCGNDLAIVKTTMFDSQRLSQMGEGAATIDLLLLNYLLTNV